MILDLESISRSKKYVVLSTKKKKKPTIRIINLKKLYMLVLNTVF